MLTQRLDPTQIADAAKILQRGGIVAFPTETVYGLGADATNPQAIERLFRAKGRPSDNPLIVHLSSPDQLSSCCHPIPPLAYRFLEAFSPGPLTLVLPKRPRIVPAVTAHLPSVAIRIPDHPTALALLAETGLPIAAPSANRSGKPSGTTWQSVLDDLDGRIDAILCDAPTRIGLESTVLDLTHLPPLVLRSGGVSLEALREIDPRVEMRGNTATLSRDSDQFVNSPGLRHRHYQPQARVRLCQDPNNLAGMPLEDSAYIGMTIPQASTWRLVQVCDTLEDYAHRLFEFFRSCDALQVKTIWCQEIPLDGLGRAIMDRLQRAAEDQVS